jgi:hypothetical protein
MLIEYKGNYFEMSHRQITDFVRDAKRARVQLDRFFAIIDLLQLPPVDGAGEVKYRNLENLEFPDTLRLSVGKTGVGFILLVAAGAVIYWNASPYPRTWIHSWWTGQSTGDRPEERAK